MKYRAIIEFETDDNLSSAINALQNLYVAGRLMRVLSIAQLEVPLINPPVETQVEK